AVRAQAARLDNAALAAFIGELLRTVHADAFGGWWEIDLRLLERRTGLGRLRLLRGLAFLKDRGLLDWRPPERSLRVTFTEPRTRRLPVDDLAVRRARRRAEARLDDLLRYARSVSCRRQFLLAYFGEHSPDRCGACDVCLGRHEPVVVTPDDEPLMRHLLQQIDRGVPRGAWFDDPPPAHRLDGLLDWLVQERFLEVEALPEARYRATDKARTLMEQWAPRDAGSPGAPPD
ncbi:MAG: RecQ family zinc-binding domain-containing protein, partial [Rhodothermales bacterium]|nr:RecQ family zinc-binding domain-containing protein [Rhodothermales bacterium]